MHAMVDIPAGIRTCSLPGAFLSDWESGGCFPLELLLHAIVGHITYRIAAPYRTSWRFADRWTPMSPGQTQSLLEEFSSERVEAAVMVVKRNTPEVLDAMIADMAPMYSLGELAAWLGWPNMIRATSGWPRSIRDTLKLRDNDYWMIDLAATALGLGSITSARTQVASMPLRISIVMPAFAVHDVLAGAVESVVNAVARLPAGTWWECIIVDDANSPPLRLRGDLPPQVRLIRSAERRFCGGARNVGLSVASGDIVVFCDADTHLDRDYLVEHASRHLIAPNLILVSLREYVPGELEVPFRKPQGHSDTRVRATYAPGWLGLHQVAERTTVHPMEDTRSTRGAGRSAIYG
jgi:hypothetical protein